MLYTEKQVKKLIEERLDKEMTERYNRERFDSIEKHLFQLEKRISELEFKVKCNEARPTTACNSADGA